MSYRVKLNIFEGPFDLLVYLIEHAQMSIYDIRISEITDQYVNYISAMQEADINVSSEFMVLAAELLEIKSKMLLPRVAVDEEGEEVFEDPRTELVAKLREYKLFKTVSEMLEERYEENLAKLERPQEDLSVFTGEPDEYLSLDIGSFAAAFRLFIQRKQRIEAVRKHYTRIERERSTMEHRIGSILKTVRKSLGSVFNFRDLVEDKKDKYDIIVTFSSLLEMAKERVVNVEQKHNYGNIEVSAGENVEKDDILRKYSPEEFREETLNE